MNVGVGCVCESKCCALAEQSIEESVMMSSLLPPHGVYEAVLASAVYPEWKKRCCSMRQ